MKYKFIIVHLPVKLFIANSYVLRYLCTVYNINTVLTSTGINLQQRSTIAIIYEYNS